MNKISINFGFLILAVLSLLFLEGGLLFRVFKDYLGENSVSSVIGVICLQAGFFAISLNREGKKYKINPEWLFVFFGVILLTSHNIYHTLEIIHTLKSNGLPQFIIGIATGVFVPILGAMLLDLLASKIHEKAFEKSEIIRLEMELKNASNNHISDMQTLLQEKQTLLQAQKELKQSLADWQSKAKTFSEENNQAKINMAQMKEKHSQDLLDLSQKQGNQSGELGEIRALNKLNAKKIAELNEVIVQKEKAYKGLDEEFKKLRQANYTLTDADKNLKKKELEIIDNEKIIKELKAKTEPLFIYENYCLPFKDYIRLGKEVTEKNPITRYEKIRELLGDVVLERWRANERNSGG